MMRSRSSRWLSGVGVAVLIGGLTMANYGGGVTPAQAHDHLKNPFKQILGKLNEISEMLMKLSNGASSSSSGGVAVNYTMRWDTNNPSTSRFTVLADFNSAAVRDNNTGLVWEQNPSTTAATDWINARFKCVDKNVGGTRGWRLPSVVELASLLDQPSQQVPPVVPAVFTGVQSASSSNPNYWSATTHAPTATNNSSGIALTLSFNDGSVGQSGKGSTSNVWCVRGPMQAPTY